MASSDVESAPRTRPPEDGVERETLTGMLDFLRASVINKVAGPTDEQGSSQHRRGHR